MRTAIHCAALVAAAVLGACAADHPNPAAEAATLVLAVGSTELADGAGVDLTAQVRDSQGRPVPGVPVQFGSDRGAVQVLAGVTDGFGTASARLGTVGARSRHTIIATARAGRLSAQAQVHVNAAVSAANDSKCCKV